VELRHLRYCIAVAETGSLTLAARRLNTSQPSLSRQIRDLEHEVGVPLFRRSSSGVTPTRAGNAFLEHAQRAWKEAENAVEAARSTLAGETKPFGLGFLTGLETLLLPRLLPLIRGHLPQGDIVLSSGYSPDLAEAVLSGKLDAAFCRAEPGYDLAYRTVGRQRLAVLLERRHPLAVKDSLTAEDLRAQEFVGMAERAPTLGLVIESYLRQKRIDLGTVRRGDNPSQVIALVASTRAVALVPDYFASLLPPALVLVSLEDGPSIDLSLAYRRDNGSPALGFVLDHLDQLAPVFP